MTKWVILLLWLGSALLMHLRGQVRLPLRRQLFSRFTILAPMNALMVLASRVPITPYIPVSRLPDLKLLKENWQTIRDEALHLTQPEEIGALAKDDGTGVDFSPQNPWKRTYLKGLDAKQPSVQALYPQTVALLNQIPNINTAMFAQLPPGAQLNQLHLPFAGSLTYHLGLSTPNETGCYVDVDDIRHVWHDGQDVILDQTYVHQAHNNTATNLLILVCDVQRPLSWRWAESFSRWFSRYAMSLNGPLKASSNQTGFANKLTRVCQLIDQNRKAFKEANHTVYQATKMGLITLAVLLFLAI